MPKVLRSAASNLEKRLVRMANWRFTSWQFILHAAGLVGGARGAPTLLERHFANGSSM